MEGLRRWKIGFGAAMTAANAFGGFIVFAFLSWLIPSHNALIDPKQAVAVNDAIFGVFSVFAIGVGTFVSLRAFRPIGSWLATGTPPDAAMGVYVLRAPMRQAVLNAGLWLLAIAVFTPLNVKYGGPRISEIALSILLAGIVTSGVIFLISERLLRVITEKALAGRAMPDPLVPGVKSRLLLAWFLGSGIPLLSVLLLVTDPHEKLEAGSVVFLSAVGLAVGAAAMNFAARSIADPIESVTAALAAVEANRLDVTVPVYDGSQVGRLQSGFNSMVEGVRERQLLRDLFGRQVGAGVLEHSLSHGGELGGVLMNASVLFIDVIGSTEMAAEGDPQVVVSTLNAVFSVVVAVIAAEGGFVNKFEGDAALCIFGAPVELADAPSHALRAARCLKAEVDAAVAVPVGIGVSSGLVVAGNIGAAERFEFTVIGDPVNEAARLTELAKSTDCGVMAAESTVLTASAEERAHWSLSDEAELRGRSRPTRIWLPAPALPAST